MKLMKIPTAVAHWPDMWSILMMREMKSHPAYYAQEWGMGISKISPQNIRSSKTYVCKFCLIFVFWKFIKRINFTNKQSLYWTLISHGCKLKTLFPLFTKQQFDWPRLLDVISFPLSIRVNFVGRHVFSRMSRLHAHHNGLKFFLEVDSLFFFCFFLSLFCWTPW